MLQEKIQAVIRFIQSNIHTALINIDFYESVPESNLLGIDITNFDCCARIFLHLKNPRQKANNRRKLNYEKQNYSF